MRGSSLATRLFLSATAWVVVILVITGFVLSSVYRDATERAFDRRLNLYLRTLVAEVATPDEPPDRQFQSLGEPLFELPLSGWYWQITRTDSEKAETRASRSLWDKKLPKLEEHGADLTAAGIRLGYVDGPEGQSLRMVERPVDLGDEPSRRGQVVRNDRVGVARAVGPDVVDGCFERGHDCDRNCEGHPRKDQGCDGARPRCRAGRDRRGQGARPSRGAARGRRDP